MRPILRRTAALLALLSFLLAACQGSLPAPTGSPAPDGTATRPPRATRTPALPTNTPAPTPTPTPLPHLDVAPEALRGLEVTFWHPWQGDLAARAGEAAKTFTRENEWGLVVRARALHAPTNLEEALDSGLDGGDEPPPDLVAALPEQLAAWQEQDRLADLNDYIASPRWGLPPAQVESMFPIFWEQDLGPGGVRAGVPALRTAAVLYYNQTWAAELGFTRPPATPAEFQAQACAAAVANAADFDKRGTGGWLASTDPITLLSWFEAFGAHPIPEGDGQPYRFETAEAGRAVAFLRELFDQGCAWEGLAPSPHAYFAGRMALFYSGSLQDLPFQARAQEGANTGDRWTVLPYPAESGKPLALSGGYSYGILTGTPEEQLGAWLFLRVLLQPRSQALLGEVYPGLPLSPAAEAELGDYKDHFPWFMVLPLREALRPAPSLASWGAVRPVLQDAAWQVYRLPADQLPLVLPQMDDLAEEILAR